MIHKSKLVVVGILLVGGVIFGLRDWEGITYGMKAATLTMAAATTLFIRFTSSQEAEQEWGRLSVGILAFLSALNWVWGEANGSDFPPMIALIVMCIALLLLVAYVLFMLEVRQDEKKETS